MSDQKRGCIGCLVLIVLTVVFAAVCTVVVNLETTEEKAEDIPQVPTEVIDLAIETIEGYPEVLDAAISQEGRQISLVLIVAYRINEDRGKQLGDNFVRIVKSLSHDDSPGKDIGRGIYDYLVGVYYPNEQQLVIGAKVADAMNLSW